MQLGGTQKISHSAQRVFVALRDRQVELAGYLPNVERVEVLRRRDDPPRTELYNRWQGASTEAPAVLRPMLSPELLAWFDEATWDETDLSCRWSLYSAKARDLFSCKGTTSITGDGDGRCTFLLDAQLEVYPDKIPGVPGFLARRVREPLETFVANLLRPNLTKIAVAVQEYLDAQPAGS